MKCPKCLTRMQYQGCEQSRRFLDDTPVDAPLHEYRCLVCGLVDWVLGRFHTEGT